MNSRALFNKLDQEIGKIKALNWYEGEKVSRALSGRINSTKMTLPDYDWKPFGLELGMKGISWRQVPCEVGKMVELRAEEEVEFGLHSHSVDEAFTVQEGKAIIFNGSRVKTYREGETCYIPAHTEHSFAVLSAGKASCYWPQLKTDYIECFSADSEVAPVAAQAINALRGK